MERKSEARLPFAARWAVLHLATSAAVVAIAALLVFLVWYPSPWRQLLGVTGIFGVVVAVDLVCGPLLTLLLASPRKSRKERWLDLSLVGVIQLAALGYGLFAVFSARPVAIVFEVDRFTIVGANEIQTQQLELAPEGMRVLPFAGVIQAGLRQPTSGEEMLESIQISLTGTPQSMRPTWWAPYDTVRSQVIQNAKPLSGLIQAKPQQAALLESAAAKSGLSMESLRYLPLTSSKVLDWVALIGPTGDVVGHAPVDGFD